MYPMMMEWWKTCWNRNPFLPFDPISSNTSSSSCTSFTFDAWPFDTALCQLDSSGRIDAITKNFSSVSGISADIGEPFHAFIVLEMHKQFFSEIETLFRTMPVASPVSFRVRMACADMRFVEIQAVRQGQGALLTLRNITHEIEQERELAKARINTDLALRARSEFLGRMSHELRTPLNAVTGFAQMIEDRVHGDLAHPIYEEYLASILKSADNMCQKIDNLVAISEAELGVVHLLESDIALNDVLSRAADHHQHAAFCKDIQLDVSGSPYLTVTADDRLLVKAISSLIENAVAASRCGGRMTIDATDLPSGEIAITVRDNGLGLSASHLRRLRAFFADGETGGNHFDQLPLGTGLVLVREYAMLHQGRVHVESVPGKGAAFTFLLPAERCARSMPSMPTFALQAIAV